MSSFTPFVAPQWSLSRALPLARAECYKILNDGLFMEEKQGRERCWRCHGGILHPTLIPNEMKCNYCGWTRYMR